MGKEAHRYGPAIETAMCRTQDKSVRHCINIHLRRERSQLVQGEPWVVQTPRLTSSNFTTDAFENIVGR